MHSALYTPNILSNVVSVNATLTSCLPLTVKCHVHRQLQAAWRCDSQGAGAAGAFATARHHAVCVQRQHTCARFCNVINIFKKGKSL